MPRKRASGSSPEKPAATPRRNTRRKAEPAEEPPVVEIPRHLLRASDSESEQSDNDSDYGSPKKGRGRGATKTTGRGRKSKVESPAEGKPTPRTRRGRKAPAAVSTLTEEERIAEDGDHSQSTQETGETTTENEAPEAEPLQQIHQADTEYSAQQKESAPVAQEIVAVKVSEVTIEQDLQSNNDQAPVNEEERDGCKESEVETGRVNVEDVKVSDEIVDEKMDSPAAEQVIEIADDESKDAPESSNQSDSRSNSPPEKVVQRSPSTSREVQEESNDKMEVDAVKHARIEAPVEKVVEAVKNAESSTTVKETPVEEKASAPIQRKRKWTARKTDDQPVIAITTDSLKTIISEEVKPVPLSDVKLMSASPEPEPEEKRQRTKPTADDKDAKKKLLKDRLRKQEEEEERRNEQLVEAIDKSQANGAPSNGSALLKDRKVSLIVDDPAAPPSPPKNESSNILYISNLVRPFTVLQLKGLLARTGKIADFWIDKIKSKCYVKYENEDEATETRHALHGVTWPSSNPKCLHVDFGKQEDMEKAILSTMEHTIRIQFGTENQNAKQEKEFGWIKNPNKTVTEDRSRGSRPVREWDVGKKDKEEFEREDRDRNRRKRSSERETRRDSKKDDRLDKRRSLSDSPSRKTEKVEGEAQPVRLLDDLFRKTKATPCIYWLPLTVEQIMEKEEQRQKNIVEHERRMEEIRKQREERMKRRSNSRDRRRDRSRDKRRRSVSRDRRYNRR